MLTFTPGETPGEAEVALVCSDVNFATCFGVLLLPNLGQVSFPHFGNEGVMVLALAESGGNDSCCCGVQKKMPTINISM